MTTSSRTRRPALTRPHPARAAGEAARAATPEPTSAGDAAPAPDAGADDDRKDGAAGTQTGERERLRSGRPSYAGRAATVYFPTASDRERARNAFRHAGGAEGYESESEWWADLIAAGVADLEARHHDGQPFPAPRRRRGQ